MNKTGMLLSRRTHIFHAMLEIIVSREKYIFYGVMRVEAHTGCEEAV